MSKIYVTEPMTRGKVTLETTIGQIDIELWPKESPKATRNFVQLCLDGFYDQCSFHRVIPNFIAQTGRTSDNDICAYDEPFENEFHSRLHFSHRGLVACAGTSRDRTRNGSQFFITLDSTPELESKHTIFGKVVGNTIYNILRVNEMALLEGYNDRLALPPSIISTKVVWNPYDDVFPRNINWHPSDGTASVPQTRGVKTSLLLSFQDDDEQSTSPKNDASPDLTNCTVNPARPIRNASLKRSNEFVAKEEDIREQLEWQSKMTHKKLSWEQVEKNVQEKLEKKQLNKSSLDDEEDIKIYRNIRELSDPNYSTQPKKTKKKKLVFKDTSTEHKSHHKSSDDNLDRQLSATISAFTQSLKK